MPSSHHLTCRWNHGKEHMSAELYQGKDSWISSLGSHNFGAHKTQENLPGNSALYATGYYRCRSCVWV